MSNAGFFTLLMARDPSRMVRFPDVPLDQALAELAALRDSLAQPAAPAPAAPADAGEGATASLCALATHVWRARSRMLDPATGQVREDLKRIHRHLEGAAEVFAQLEVRVSDWLGQPYDAGLPVNVLMYQPTPGLTRDTIVEVTRPTVFWRDKLVQLGEVVVGTPENTPPAQP